MLVIFKSKAGADIMMFEENAKQILDLFGKDTHKGIITSEETGPAIIALEKEIERRKQIEAEEKAERERREKEEQERRSHQETASPFFFFILYSILKPLSAHCAFPQKTYHFPGRQYPKCADLPPVPRKLRFYCITPFASNV